MAAKALDAATLRTVSKLLAAETDDFNALVRLAGLDPARDFRHTDMSGTSMVGADLRGFDFTGADFRNVTLDGALLDGTCFRGADLSGTDLSAARGLKGTDCSFAVLQDDPFAPEMVVLPAGSFLMGSPEGEVRRSLEEGPQRQVTLARFAIGRYPVTFAEYDHFCEATEREKPGDEGWDRGRMPVIDISWDDTRAYAAWLAKTTGKAYRLPSEAEWEYACRAGTTTTYWWGDTFDPAMANTEASGHGKTTEVGSYPANSWGLFDTLGNVLEWTEDHWHESYLGAPNDGRAWIDEPAPANQMRVSRGGAWIDNAARCAGRNRASPNCWAHYVGFRVVCSSPY